MTAHDRIRLIGPFAEFEHPASDFYTRWCENDSPGQERFLPGLTIWARTNDQTNGRADFGSIV